MSSFYGNRHSKAEPKPGTMDFEEVKLENLPPYTPCQYEGKHPVPYPEVALQVVAPRKRDHRKWTIIIILMILGAMLTVAIVAGVWNNAMNANKANENDGPTGPPKVIATTTIMSVSVDTVTAIPATHITEITGTPTTATPISIPAIIVPGHAAGPLPSISVPKSIHIPTPPASSSTAIPSVVTPAVLLPDPGVGPSTSVATPSVVTPAVLPPDPGVGPSTSVATRSVETPADPFPSNHHYQVTPAAAATTPFDNPHGNDDKM